MCYREMASWKATSTQSICRSIFLAYSLTHHILGLRLGLNTQYISNIYKSRDVTLYVIALKMRQIKAECQDKRLLVKWSLSLEEILILTE